MNGWKRQREVAGQLGRLGCCLALGGLLALSWCAAARAAEPLTEINVPAPPERDREGAIAIVGGRLIDGRSGEVSEDAVVLVEGERITAAGPRSEVPVPEGAKRVEAEGQTIVPGLIDSHFHSINDNALLGRFLAHGVTTLRDPGHPFRFYQSLAFAEGPMPRVFLVGAHLDGYPPVWEQQALIVRDEAHARAAVRRHVRQGATGIKTYFNLPLKYYEAICDEADELSVPVMAHLELVDADDAIRAGLDGVEHVTSFGTAMAEPTVAKRFKAAIREDYGARRERRYRMWAGLDLGSPRVRAMIDLVVERDVVVSPTLAVFERRQGDDGVSDYHVRGFEKMLRFVGMCHEAGARIVVGSHTWVPHAETGEAYQRELELLVEAGLTPMEAITAGTLENARYFGSEQRLGTVEPGKLADLVLVEGNPAGDIEAMYDVQRVMLNGRWVNREE